MPRAKPFVKWAGGKGKILHELELRFPAGFPNRECTYWEPFLGGGAVFFAIADRIEHAVLSDLNADLMTAYRVIKTNLEQLLEKLEFHTRKHAELGKQHYYPVREQAPQNEVDVAARFLYLNKTCYNGLYRVNRAGRFNVPIGDYKNPRICDTKNLRAVHEALKRAELRCGDYLDDRVTRPGDRDFVYCDPPYDQTFSQYVSEGFGKSDQEALFNRATEWAQVADVMVSNAQTELIKRIWTGGGVDTLNDSSTPSNWFSSIKSRQYS